MLSQMKSLLTRIAAGDTAIAGWMLFAAIVASIILGLGLPISAVVPGLAFWLAGLLLLHRVRGLPRIQMIVMLLVGLAGLGYAAWTGGSAEITKAISANQALLAMLGGVTFLRLISLPEVDAGEEDPRGPHALWRTLFGVHLFGSVINLSAVMILGDRQSRRAPMTSLQATVLSRGFSLAALWSPFFAAMGIALSNAPGAQLTTLSLVGLPLAVLGLVISGRELTRSAGGLDFVGYPMHFGALWIPGLLALMVLAAHEVFRAVPILTFISLLSILLTAVVLVVRHGNAALQRLQQHVRGGLPQMSGELALFLAAGVLAAGIASVAHSGGWRLDIEHVGATEASALLLVMVAVSVAGVHPVISISTAHGLLAPMSPDPNLMGITYLMTWAAGVSSSPFSGMHLGMQGRFGIDPRGFLRWNGRFTLIMLFFDVVALHIFERFYI